MYRGPFPTRHSRARRAIRQAIDFVRAPRASQVWVGIGATLGIVVIAAISVAGRSAAAPGQENLSGVTPAYLPDELRPALEPSDSAAQPIATKYSVRQGDTLVAVAYRFGVTADTIRVASQLDNMDMLSVGQTLTIPPALSKLVEIDSEMTVREVADSYGVDPSTVAAYNGMDNDAVDEP